MNFLEKAIDELDACLFTGDPTVMDVASFRDTLARWGRVADQVERDKQGDGV